MTMTPSRRKWTCGPTKWIENREGFQGALKRKWTKLFVVQCMSKNCPGCWTDSCHKNESEISKADHRAFKYRVVERWERVVKGE